MLSFHKAFQVIWPAKLCSTVLLGVLLNACTPLTPEPAGVAQMPDVTASIHPSGSEGGQLLVSITFAWDDSIERDGRYDDWVVLVHPEHLSIADTFPPRTEVNGHRTVLWTYDQRLDEHLRTDIPEDWLRQAPNGPNLMSVAVLRGHPQTVSYQARTKGNPDSFMLYHVHAPTFKTITVKEVPIHFR